MDAFLVPGGADDPERVKIHRPFDNVGRISIHPFGEDGVSLEKDVLQ